MSFSVDFHSRMAQHRVAAALEFLKDPTAPGRRYQAELVAEGSDAGCDATYPYSLGTAESLLDGLLDACGYPVHGPDRFDCQRALEHPYVEDEDLA
jgi:hypothetical protein